HRWPAALAGIVAAGLGLGVAELLTGLFNRGITPVLAVGEAVIELSPTWLTEWAIETFGTADKLVLISGVVVVLTVFAAAIGVLAARHRGAGMLAAAGLGAVAGLAVWSRPDTVTYDLLPVIAGAGAAVLALPALARRAAAEPVPTAGSVAPDMRMDRRAFVQAAGVTAAAAVAAGSIGRLLGGRRRAVEASRTDVDVALPRALPAAEPVPGADLEIDGSEPWLTPNDDFYRIDTALSVPLIQPDDWTLRVHGMVEREVVLGFDDLVGLGLVDRWVTLCCVSNAVGGSLIGNALWTGVRVADVLGLAGPHADADAVLSTSHDGWTCGTPLEVLTDGRDSIFAVAMNGEPLPVEHGFPVRMVVPGLYGYVSATKWVVDLQVSRFDEITAYWTSRGWSERGPVKVSSRIDVPRNGATVQSGPVAVAGVAWAQHRGIEAVEVRVDGGPWRQADLGAVPNADTWRQWVWHWDAEQGRHRLEVRAITADGEEQTGTERPPAPDGATGWHGVAVTVEG
ncbi:MAG TPA: molybdopterin-dependent oxidoreductase, partial [Jiangellaceae bacterium]|nr:molybdopterin-dependent oxidoreductase [Jiangellaceae bacterium]